MEQSIVEIEVENDVDQPACQHSIRKRAASLNALEKMQISKFGMISSILVLAMNSADEESFGDSVSDSEISSIASSTSTSEIEGIVAACFLLKAKRLSSMDEVTTAINY